MESETKKAKDLATEYKESCLLTETKLMQETRKNDALTNKVTGIENAIDRMK